MKIQIGKILLTTDHPASHYGAGVAIIDTVPHAPDGLINIGSDNRPRIITVAQKIESAVQNSKTPFTAEEIRQINKFLSQSPTPITLNFEKLQKYWEINQESAQ